MASQIDRTALEDRIPLYESEGFSNYDVDAPFETIREMFQEDEMPRDYGDDAQAAYWDVFEDSAMAALDKVTNALAGEGQA